MNQSTTNNNVLGFEVKLETKSLIILGLVILIAGVGILMFKKITQ